MAKRRSRNHKWLVTGGLVLAMAGGLYHIWPESQRTAPASPPAQSASASATTPSRKQAARVVRPAMPIPAAVARPVAPAVMPADAERIVAVPRPPAAVGATP